MNCSAAHNSLLKKSPKQSRYSEFTSLTNFFSLGVFLTNKTKKECPYAFSKMGFTWQGEKWKEQKRD